MNKKLIEIHEYLLKIWKDEKRIEKLDRSSVGLAMEIAVYAHRNQKRENQEDYINHPLRVLDNYRLFAGLIPGSYFSIDTDLMFKHKIPYDGVQEVCLLHDVVEDTDFTIEDIKEIYSEYELKNFFEMYIEIPLKNITHDKTMNYLEYIGICLNNPTSALVKMMDLQDNLRVVDLIKLTEKELNRATNYLKYIYIINSVYNFLENAKKYRDEFQENDKNE